jgi:hypothetical protein
VGEHWLWINYEELGIGCGVIPLVLMFFLTPEVFSSMSPTSKSSLPSNFEMVFERIFKVDFCLLVGVVTNFLLSLEGSLA